MFTDLNGNGVQDAGEPGIPGVRVNLVSMAGFVADTVTDADGNYAFEVDAGDFTCEIDGTNFAAGGPLEGRTSTTGGETIADTVVDDNRLDYDFGYDGVATGSIGDFVWFDDNTNGLQDELPASGLAGITVELTAPSGGTQTAITDANGFYLFESLGPGTHTVRVVEPLPLAFTVFSTTVNNPLAVSLGIDEAFRDADFGYGPDFFGPEPQDSDLGDLVWNDLNGDGDSTGEPGIGGVTLDLAGDLDGDGLSDLFRSTVSNPDGTYQFSFLPQGTYRVTVDAGTLPAGITIPTFDRDGLGTPSTAIAFLPAGDTDNDYDFGLPGRGGRRRRARRPAVARPRRQRRPGCR